jgi:hypothetical protein
MQSEPITPGYWLKKEYLVSPAVSEDNSLDSYMEILKKEGAWFNPCLKPAIFQIRNGLRYPGIMTTKNLAGP